jgi:hypothetical protein
MSLPSKIIQYPVGTFDLGNRSIVLPDGATLEGMGMTQTILIYHGTFDEIQTGIPGSGIIPGNNTTIRNLRIIARSSPYYAGCIGTRQLDGDRPSQNVLIENVQTDGETDAIYIRHPEACQWKLVNCILNTQWDLVMLAGALHDIEIIDSTLNADSVGFVISGMAQDANCTTIVGGKLVLDECTLSAIASPGRVARGLWTHNDLGFVPGSSITARKCKIKADVFKEQALNTTIKTIRTPIPK